MSEPSSLYNLLDEDERLSPRSEPSSSSSNQQPDEEPLQSDEEV